MKNKFIILLLVLILKLNFYNLVASDEFIFEVTDIEILENGNLYKGNNRGKIKTDKQIEIISDSFEYLKEKNLLKSYGNAQLTDKVNNITINAQKIFYNKNEEKIYTIGKTLINVSNKYTVNGNDLTLLKNEMILLSNKTATIEDNYSNNYILDKFQYYINQEILKGEKIQVNNNNNDKYFFEYGFLDLKENKFLSKDINVKLNKAIYGNDENDPRIYAVSGYGDKFSSFYEKAVFTSCKKTDKCPPWKITSKKIKHDKVKKQIIYKDAWLQIYDFPVIYFPKFFHPDPTVKRQSGFLTPELGSSTSTGDSIYIPYFYALSENKDLTVKPRLFSNKKLILQNEYRQKTKNSFTIADFSITKGHDSNVNDKGDSRSHFFSNTKIDLLLSSFQSSVLDINFEKVSNDNYLKLFNLEASPLIKNTDLLESIIRLDLEHQDYDLSTYIARYETLDGKNSDRYQYILPSYNFSKNFIMERFDGSFNFNSYGNNTQRNTNVVTSIFSNDLNYNANNIFFDNGVKSNFEIQFKNINAVGKNDTQYKDTLQSEILSSYIYNVSLPLEKKNQKNLNTLEPRLSFRASPHEMKDTSTLDGRINIDNIFSSNRTGTFESGESLTLGLNYKNEKVNIKNEINEIEQYFDFKLATSFRLKQQNKISRQSTLNNKQSNFFGGANFYPSNNISLNYDFSLTDNLDELQYSSLVVNFNHNQFSTKFDFIEERGVIGQTNLIQNFSKYTFNKENSLTFNTRKNRRTNLTEFYDLVYEYKNDCLIAALKYNKNYYNDSDIKPVEELFFTITIVPLTTFSPDKLLK